MPTKKPLSKSKKQDKPCKQEGTFEDKYARALSIARGNAKDMPEAPAWIGKWGVLEWYELGQCLHNENLFRGYMDYSIFAKYCNQHDTYVEICRAIAREGKIVIPLDSETGYGEVNPKLRMVDSILKNIMSMVNRFGITPMSRNTLDMPNTKEYNRIKEELGLNQPPAIADKFSSRPKGF